MSKRNPFSIGDGKYTVYYSNPMYKEPIKKFTGICENFNSSGLSAFWNEDKQQMLLVRYSEIVGLYPIK